MCKKMFFSWENVVFNKKTQNRFTLFDLRLANKVVLVLLSEVESHQHSLDESGLVQGLALIRLLSMQVAHCELAWRRNDARNEKKES